MTKESHNLGPKSHKLKVKPPDISLALKGASNANNWGITA